MTKSLVGFHVDLTEETIAISILALPISSNITKKRYRPSIKCASYCIFTLTLLLFVPCVYADQMSGVDRILRLLFFFFSFYTLRSLFYSPSRTYFYLFTIQVLMILKSSNTTIMPLHFGHLHLVFIYICVVQMKSSTWYKNPSGSMSPLLWQRNHPWRHKFYKWRLCAIVMNSVHERCLPSRRKV